MQSPPRTENLPVPLPPVFRGQLAERADYTRWNGNGHYLPPPPPQPHPHPELVQPGHHSTYFQILTQQILKRWKVLAVWLALTAAAAYAVVTKYAKPTWKAEGQLLYSPDYTGNKRLYTPPNIQTILALAKSPEIAEKVSKEFEVPDASSKLKASLVTSSDFIAIVYDGADKQKAEAVVNRAMALVIEQYDQLRNRLSKDAIVGLDEKLERARTELLASRHRLNEALGKKGIIDLRTETSTVIHEIAEFRKEISGVDRREEELLTKQKVLGNKIANINGNPQNKNGPLTEADLNRLKEIRELESKKNLRRTEVETAKIEQKALEENRRKLLPLKEKGYVTPLEWSELEVKLKKSHRTIVDGEADIADADKLIEQLKASPLQSLPAQQANFELAHIEAELASLPKKTQALKSYLKEREDHLAFLQSAEKEATQIQQEIDTLQQRYTALVGQKQDNERLEEFNTVKGPGKASGELTIHSPGSAGNAPASSNTVKLISLTFGLSILLFVGFVALFDMPRTLPSPANANGLPAHGSQLPVPVWYFQPQAVPMPQYMPPHQPPHPYGNGSAFVNEHLRALAERIAFNPLEDKGKIVLFTPTARGLGVENVLGDLACHLIKETGRVLVFEARTDVENPAFPAWTGPSAREAAEQTINYLEGRSERSAGCFAETLISQIDYARADLTRHLQSVMAMYRFRRLVNEMKDRYALVLMITPERYRGEEDDVFTTLGDGIVVVINPDADPADVEQYIRGLSACETPVYGAFTVPSANGAHAGR